MDSNFFSSPTFFIILGVVVAVYLLFMVLYVVKKQKQKKQFLLDNPDTVRVKVDGFLSQNTMFDQTSGTVGNLYVLHEINGVPAKVESSVEFFLQPGKNTLKIEFISGRPGVLHKTVSTNYGVSSIEVDAEPGKKYLLSYDKKENRYNFIESGK